VPATVRVAMDLQALQVDGFADRGIGRYVAGLAPALERNGRLAAGLLSPELQPPAGLPADLAVTGRVHYDGAVTTRRLTAEHERLAHFVPAPFLFTGPTEPSSLVPAPHWAATGAPRVVLLHDLIPLQAPRRYLPTDGHVERYRARAEWVATADLVVTNSEHTRSESLDLLGRDRERTVTIGAGVSSFFSPPDGTDEDHFRFHLGDLGDRPFILTVGGSDVRKGTERLIAAMGQLWRGGLDLHLVVVGDLTDQWRARLMDAAQAVAYADRLHLTGAVGDELLRACYRRAQVTVMPSLAEGFGLAVLESAACGTAALAASTSALGEVAGSELATFDPTDTDDLARVLADTLSDPDRRRRIAEAQATLAASSTWDAVAGRLARALDLLGTGLPAPAWTATRSRRIALVGPVPPLAGGIARFNARVLEALPPHIAADAVSPLPWGAELPPGVGHVPADAFGPDARPCSYDAVVYTLGNSDGHLATVELALRHPGWLWLHEVRLPAVAVTALPNDPGARDRSLADLAARAYPGRAPRRAVQMARGSVSDLATGGVGLTSLLTERCRGVIVNSQAARNLLLLDLPPGAHHPPVHVLPLPCPAVAPVSGADIEEDLVVALGIVSSAKRPEILVDAAAVAGCRLAFVGPCPPVLAEFIGDRARARGTSSRVEVTAEVDDAEWRAWLERAVLAVQLRDSGTGESSSAITEAFSAGVPVVTNMAPVTEYPEGTATWLPSLDPDKIGSAIRRLLDDPEGRRRQAESALGFAAEHQFRQLAEALALVLAE